MNRVLKEKDCYLFMSAVNKPGSVTSDWNKKDFKLDCRKSTLCRNVGQGMSCLRDIEPLTLEVANTTGDISMIHAALQ